jgi:divalent metal cation (Fe/Co/Zn/Cd) transporter
VSTRPSRREACDLRRAPSVEHHDHHDHHSDLAPEERSRRLERGLKLEYFSLAWNFLETFVGMAAGIAAGSIALIGFALDSVVESSSAAVLIWRLRSERSGRDVESIERRAVRLVAVAFWGLAAYIGTKAVIDLISQNRPDESVVGIALAIVSLVVMPILAARKRAAARELDSRAMSADSSQTSLCTYISAFLLVGLCANALLGWWWADPLAGLAIAAFAAKEGHELWTTEDFCAH